MRETVISNRSRTQADHIPWCSPLQQGVVDGHEGRRGEESVEEGGASAEGMRGLENHAATPPVLILAGRLLSYAPDPFVSTFFLGRTYTYMVEIGAKRIVSYRNLMPFAPPPPVRPFSPLFWVQEPPFGLIFSMGMYIQISCSTVNVYEPKICTESLHL